MRWLTLLLFFLAACAKGAEADLPSIGEARSLVAEWALVNDLATEGRLNPTYVKAMRRQLRQQVQTASRSLTEPRSRYGAEIKACLELPDDAAPAILRAHSEVLKQIEDSLESA